MAGRVLRSSNGRFNGSTKGWRGGLKKPSNSRFVSVRTDIYRKKDRKTGTYSVISRKRSKGEVASVYVGMALAGASGNTLVGGAIGGGLGYWGRTVPKQPVIKRGLSEKQASQAIKAARAQNKLEYARAQKNIKAGKKAKKTKSNRMMSTSIG